MDRPVKLTNRGQEVAELIALGLSNREIGKRLFLSQRTVEWHIEQILNRLGFNSRSEIAAWVGRSQTGTAVRVPGARRRGNLPAPLTSFVGRERDTDALKDLLAKHRLVSITGPGGSGKTRLAIKVAEELEPSYPDRAWLCDLAPVANAELIADAIAQALGLANEIPDRLVAVRTHLSERTALLVLDNCEHLLAAAASVAGDLLAACRGLQILATSLAPLGVLGEAVWPLQPLPQTEAVELFLDRAQAAAPGFALDAGSRAAINTICRRLDCLPLALELAAPKLRALSTAELADALLEAIPARSSDRHRSLEAVADWGYQTLEETERELLMRLSIFAGWFELEDAAAIAPADAIMQFLLAALVEKSMLAMERTAEGRARYRQLETLKAFARKRLSVSDMYADVRLAHGERMIWLAEQPAIYTIDTRSAQKVVAFVDDMRAAMVFLLQLRPKRATRLAAALTGFWRVSGRHLEGIRWDDAALEADPEPSFDRSWLLYGHAILMLDLDRRTEAMSAFREANAMASLPECQPMRGYLLTWRGWVEQLLGDVGTSTASFREAIDEFDRAGGNTYSTRALAALAASLLSEGRHEEARDLAERTLMLVGRIPEVLALVAQANAMWGDLDRARDHWLEGAARAYENQFTAVLAECLEGLAYAAALRDKAPAALRLHHCAESLLSEVEGRYSTPIAPRVAECMQRLEAEVGLPAAALLRAEGEALTMSEAIEMAKAEG